MCKIVKLLAVGQKRELQNESRRVIVRHEVSCSLNVYRCEMLARRCIELAFGETRIVHMRSMTDDRFRAAAYARWSGDYAYSVCIVYETQRVYITRHIVASV